MKTPGILIRIKLRFMFYWVGCCIAFGSYYSYLEQQAKVKSIYTSAKAKEGNRPAEIKSRTGIGKS
ncbi:MAG: hypothetical protein WKG06_26825 [Segetibacter sp.]